MTRLPRKGALATGTWVHAAVLCVLMLISLWAVFVYVPTERTMGIVQRIFYYHAPSGMLGFLGFGAVLVGSVLFLVQQHPRWDHLAHAAAEVGMVFCTINLVTGPIWARPVWGVWWTWDARLTLSLVLWLLYVAYLMLRRYVLEDARRGNLAAVVGIVGSAAAVLDYFSIRWWRTQHPQPVLGGDTGSGLAPEMTATLALCSVAFLVLFAYLVHRRATLAALETEINELYKRVQLS